MANFDAQIQDLVGDSMTDNAAMNDWMTQGAREIINILPPELLSKCTSRSTLNNAALTLDLDGKGRILYVVRLSADSNGYQKACRQIPGLLGDLSNDSSDMMYYATETDPVYWITSDSSGNPTLFVKPLPTANQPAYVHHVTYPSITASDESIIANFPDEAEHLVVLYAAIKAAESLLASEEDIELYGTMIAGLKQDYDKGIQLLLTKGVPPAPSPKGG